MPAHWSELVEQATSARLSVEIPRNIKLPTIPQVVLEFTAIANNPNATLKELAEPIESDASLTTDILRHVNSLAMGLRWKVGSVPQAINLLGPRRTKTLVLTSALQSASTSTSTRLLNISHVRKENRMRAIFASKVAQAVGGDGSVAYIAGLLQDFLLPVLTESFYSDYVNFPKSKQELVVWERNQFGWDHALVGASVMREWGFPDELVACVLFHHDARRILSDQALWETSASASLAAAALPDSVNQSPLGFDTLMELQEVLPNFRFLEIAYQVDDELSRGESIAQRHEATQLQDGLFDRLERMAEAKITSLRETSVERLKRIGNYIVERQLGNGAMGVIYLGKHWMIDRPAAIKVIRASTVSAKQVMMFETEVRLTCSLTNPHTVSVYDYGVTDEGMLYYVMEYLEGVTLAELVKNHGPQPPGRVIHFLRQVCNSLAEAHSLKLIHRDLKPENMMVCRRGGVADMVKVLDFGLAKVVSQPAMAELNDAKICGTPLYMSPEAITAPQSVDARSDIYSIGAVGYFLLTGAPVFVGATLRDILRSQVEDTPERPSIRGETSSNTDLDDLIMRCLAKSPDDRPPSAEELDHLLSECRGASDWNQQSAARWWSHHEAHREEDHPPRPSIMKSDAGTDELTETLITDMG